MATVTKPIALDESFNTTEVTPRNIADVLAEGLSHITGRTASEVEYDNTDSGLTADNVQDALDEIAESVPTLPTTDIQTAVDEFSTYNGGLLSECKVALSPNQDLHGYTEPWVGGAGKNVLNFDLANQTIRGVTLTNNNGVLTLNGTNDGTGNSDFVVGAYSSQTAILPSGTYKFIVSDTNNNVRMLVGYNGNILGSTYTSDIVTASNGISAVIIRVATGVTVNNVTVKPMVTTDQALTYDDWTPYENICPISGHTQVEVGDDGKNRFDDNAKTLGAYLDADGTTSGSGASDITDYILIKSGNAVSFSFKYDSLNSSNTRIVCFYDKNKQFTEYTQYVPTSSDKYTKATFTPTNPDSVYIRITLDKGAKEVQVELGSTATPYEPYNGYQVTVNLGGTYYSGTLDVVSGVLTVDKVKAVTPTRGSLDSSGKLYTISFSGGTIHNHNNTATATPYIICSHLDVDSLVGARDTQRKCICQYAGGVYIGGYVGEETALDNMLASADFSIVFELATPQSIQLSPTMVKALVGENHLSAPLEGQEITESKYRELFTWNEVESYVNAHSGGGSGMNYSTEEQVVGTWIDGKPLYQKTIDCGALPNNTAKNITTPSNLKYLVNAYGFAYSPADITYQRLVPFSSGGTNDIRVDLESGNVRIVTYSNWSAYNAYLTLQYTKTTD